MFAIMVMMLSWEAKEIYMVCYDLRVERQNIFGSEKISIAADANNTVALRIHFDACWRVYDQKAAIFKTRQNRYYIIEMKSSEVKVPWEALTEVGELEMSVIGFDDEKVLTAGKVTLEVVSSLLPEEYKQLSPTETLFDRFKAECTQEAYNKYKNEIASLKRDYEKKLLDLGDELNEANENTKKIEAAKNKELEALEQGKNSQITTLNLKIADITAELNEANVDAGKWRLVNAAMADKVRSNLAPWAGGTKEYKLPMFNTENMSTISNASFDNNCTELGLNLASATELDQAFRGKLGFKKLTFINTNSITSMVEAFLGCTALREVILDGVKSCKSFKHTFNGCTSLERVELGESGFPQSFYGTFMNCSALKEIVGTLDFTVTKEATSAFSGCSALEEVRFEPDTISVELGFSSCNKLSRKSMLSLFDGLREVSDLTLILSNYAFENNFPTATGKAEIRSMLKEKGWNLSLT